MGHHPVFDPAKITSLHVSADDADDSNMPWNILGWDGGKWDEERCRFVIHSGGIESGFESEWALG